MNRAMPSARTPLNVLVNMPSQFAGKPSGVARVTFCLLEKLLDQTPHCYTLRSPWQASQLPPPLQHPRLRIMPVRRPRAMILDVLLQIFTMPLLCWRHQIDVLLNVDPFGSAYGGSRRITIVHDLYFKVISHQIGWRAVATTGLIYWLVLRRSNTIVCVSESTRQDLLRYFPNIAGRSLTIHSDSTLPDSDCAETLPDGVSIPFILAVGNATSNKNFSLLAKAFSGLSDRYPELHLVHVGADEGETILSQMNEKTRRKVIRLRNIDDCTLGALYKRALCLCVTSLYEGFCLPVLEAQERGCPVICSDVSATPEIAGDGAIKFSPSDAEGLSRAIEAVLGNPDLRMGLAEAGHRNRSRFSWARAADRYAELIEGR